MNLVTREELDAVRNHISNIPPVGAMYAPVLVEHCRALLDEVERQREEVFSAIETVLDRFDCTCGRDDYRHRTSIADGHNPTRCDICNGDPCPKCQLDYALRDAR